MVSVTRGGRRVAAGAGLTWRASASLVLDFFACVWAVAAVVSAALPQWALAIPVAVSAALAVAALRAAGRLPPRTPSERRRVGRITAVATLGEGVAIVVAVNVLAGVGRPDEIAPAVALIVGLHFVPMGWMLPSTIYRATATALIASGLAGFALPASHRTIAVCLASAVILWTTAIASSSSLARGRA